MPGTFQLAEQIQHHFTYFKGTVECRVAGSNKFLGKIHEAAGYCITGGFGASATKQDPDNNSITYYFWFWTFDGAQHPLVYSDPWVDFPPSGTDCVHKATAWYLGGGGPGPPAVGLLSFNMSTGVFAGESPVAAPAELVGATSASTVDQGWEITAKDYIGQGSHTEPFHHWWLTNNPPQATHDKSLSLAQKVGGIAVAFYGEDEPDGRPKDPGLEIEIKPGKDAFAEVKGSGYDVINPADFSIYVRILDRLDRLEQAVHGGRSFISRAERPDVRGPDSTRRKRKT